MKLFDINEVGFETVMRKYRADNGSKNDWWEERNLQRANERFGRWIMAKIPIAGIGELIMPYYNHGGKSITPEEGAPLSVAYDNFIKNKHVFQRENSQFCERFESQRAHISKHGVKPIYLSQEPLFMGTSYSKLTPYKNRITHLDGFHRLMAVMGLQEKPRYVECYIAVRPTFNLAT